jgi:hypothetical protein
MAARGCRPIHRHNAERDQSRQAWIRTTEILMAAGERGGSIDEATDAVDAALFLQGKLELKK